MNATGSGGVDERAPAARRWTGGWLLRAALSLALVVAIFVFVLPRVADLRAVGEAIRGMDGVGIAALAVAAVWNLATYGFVWMACLPGLGFLQAGVAAEASTAVANTVPGGSYLAIGLTSSMLHSWGFRRSVTTLTLLISGVWNTFAKLALPVVALVALSVQGGITPGRVLAAVAGVLAIGGAVALAILALRSETSAARVGATSAAIVSRILRVARRPPTTGWDIALIRFRQKTIGLVRTRWHVMTVATLISHLSLYAVLLVALRAVGVEGDDVSVAEALAAFSFTRLVTAIPVTPSGLGVVELALTGALVAAGGDRDPVVAAVLVYRVLTFLPPVPIGVASYVVWQVNRSWRREALPSAAVDEPAVPAPTSPA